MKKSGALRKNVCRLWVFIVFIALFLTACETGDGGSFSRSTIEDFISTYSGTWESNRPRSGQPGFRSGNWLFAIDADGRLSGDVWDSHGTPHRASGVIIDPNKGIFRWAVDNQAAWPMTVEGTIFPGSGQVWGLVMENGFRVGQAAGDNTLVDRTGPLDVNILHVNDTHEKVDPQSSQYDFIFTLNNVNYWYRVGGYARLAAAIKAGQAAADRDQTLLLHAGDTIQGSLYASLYKGQPSFELFNYLGFEAMTLGNHEFDFGPELLGQRIREARFPVICANINVSAEPALEGLVRPYIIRNVGGQAVGLIGLLYRETEHTSAPGPNVEFLSVTEAAREFVRQLEEVQVNKIVVLSHLGYEADQELARTVPGLDVIVGGHSHTLLGQGRQVDTLALEIEGPYPTRIETSIPSLIRSNTGDLVCVVQAWEYGRALGDLRVGFDGQGRVTECTGQSQVLIGEFTEDYQTWTPVDQAAQDALTAYFADNPNVAVFSGDAEAARMMVPYQEGVEAMKNEVIGRAEDTLPGGSPHRLPDIDNPLGSVVAAHVAQSLLRQTRKYGYNVDLALINAGGVRDSILQGDITVAMVREVLPFDNELVVLELTGADVRAAVSHAVDRAAGGQHTGAFPYFSRLRYTADSFLPQDQKITNLEVLDNDGNWIPLQDERTYLLTTIAYLAGGGDDYQALTRAVSQQRTGFVYCNAFIDYIKEAQVLRLINTNVNYDGLNPY